MLPSDQIQADCSSWGSVEPKLWLIIRYTFEPNLYMTTVYPNVTDRRTDGRKEGQTDVAYGALH